MKPILQKIVEYKKKEVATSKDRLPVQQLKKFSNITRKPISMEEAILNGSGVIAEFKRASPSQGMIRDGANLIDILTGYEAAGASGSSVLTDNYFFKAHEEDLQTARANVALPLLRKDFIIDEYQIIEAKAMGADCILLIAAILAKEQIKNYLEIAFDLGLEAIVEVHQVEELERLCGREKMVGVNNRNLDTFQVSIETSLTLAPMLASITRITESGLGESSNLANLIDVGYSGFLVGESFMRQSDPGKACMQFVNRVNKLKK